MAKLLPVGYDIEDYSVEEIVEHYVESRKEWSEDDVVQYIQDLIESLEYLKTYYKVKNDESS